MRFEKEFWNQQYLKSQTGWDIGYPSPPLVDYINQLNDKNLRILIPGAGNAWEIEYLWQKGYVNTFLLDYSTAAIEGFISRNPDFPADHIYNVDFFDHQEKYDLILEQTFLSSLFPHQREDYVKKMHELLLDQAKLVGVVFNHEFPFDGPPFGAYPASYISLLEPYFEMLVFEEAYNSIKPRKGNENFLIAKRKINN